MSQVGRKHGPTADQIITQSKEWLGPERTAVRQAEIDALPQVIWKGRQLWTVRCHGTSGKGPHDVNLPLAMLWSLIWLHRYFCPYHAGDAWGDDPSMTTKPPSARVIRCYETYRDCTSANPPANAALRMHRLSNDLAMLSTAEQAQYYKLIQQLRMLIHLEGTVTEWT